MVITEGNFIYKLDNNRKHLKQIKLPVTSK